MGPAGRGTNDDDYYADFHRSSPKSHFEIPAGFIPKEHCPSLHKLCSYKSNVWDVIFIRYTFALNSNLNAIRLIVADRIAFKASVRFRFSAPFCRFPSIFRPHSTLTPYSLVLKVASIAYSPHKASCFRCFT